MHSRYFMPKPDGGNTMALKVPLAILADSANVSIEGKLNVLGVFQHINVPQFPYNHPALALVFSVTGDSGDTGKPHDLKIDFVNDDGKSFLKVAGKIQFGQPKPGVKPQANQIININGLLLEKPGTYEFKIIINNEERESIPIEVRQAKAPKKKSP
jgi:hypothetical protein